MGLGLKKTALFDEHVRLQGKIVPFAGWELPIQYSGLANEHLACRKSAGIFDVSHMGEFVFLGSGAEAFLNFITTNDVTRLKDGEAQYTLLGNESGGIIDDLIIYKRNAEDFFVVVNAANIDKNFLHIQNIMDKYGKKFGRFEFGNVSSKFTQIALQGPKAEAILKKISYSNSLPVKAYTFTEGQWSNDKIQCFVARTGYTGEDGFELYVPWDKGPAVWNLLMKEGEEFGITPCGLGARDTLRAEMKYPLYGNELSDSTSPYEAGLGWVVKLTKKEFLGKDPMTKVKEKGPQKKLVGFKLLERGVPRKDYLVFDETGKKEIGTVTTGTHAPSLNTSIGIAYVQTPYAAVGTPITIDIRDRKFRAEICETPFNKSTSLYQKS